MPCSHAVSGTERLDPQVSQVQTVMLRPCHANLNGPALQTGQVGTMSQGSGVVFTRVVPFERSDDSGFALDAALGSGSDAAFAADRRATRWWGHLVPQLSDLGRQVAQARINLLRVLPLLHTHL